MHVTITVHGILLILVLKCATLTFFQNSRVLVLFCEIKKRKNYILHSFEVLLAFNKLVKTLVISIIQDHWPRIHPEDLIPHNLGLQEGAPQNAQLMNFKRSLLGQIQAKNLQIVNPRGRDCLFSLLVQHTRAPILWVLLLYKYLLRMKNNWDIQKIPSQQALLPFLSTHKVL